ncbi:MAG: hypothetical protein IJM19_08045 [Ruminococcus sp.]|nr:hypothetical protein [Ruminococcus sp.]MBR6385484.1 hypothetical protein [Ruminococcus sp.]
MTAINPALFAENQDFSAVLAILAVFTVSFVSCGIFTYRLMRKKNKRNNQPENRQEDSDEL